MTLRLGMALREGDGVENHVLAVDDPDHAHFVEGDDPLNGGAHTVEDLAELDRLRRYLGDLGENAGYQLSIKGSGCEAQLVPVRGSSAGGLGFLLTQRRACLFQPNFSRT